MWLCRVAGTRGKAQLCSALIKEAQLATEQSLVGEGTSRLPSLSQALITPLLLGPHCVQVQLSTGELCLREPGACVWSLQGQVARPHPIFLV